MLKTNTGVKTSQVREIPADLLVAAIAQHLKDSKKFAMPKWAELVKTAAHHEMPPADKDWWYTRVAAILRQVYLHPGTGVGSLKTHFGSNKDNGSAPSHHAKASGKIIRVGLQQLQAMKWIDGDDETAGRRVTPLGQKQVDAIARAVKSE